MFIIEKEDWIRPTFEAEIWPSHEGGWRRILIWRRWWVELSSYPHPKDPEYQYSKWEVDRVDKDYLVDIGWTEGYFHALTFRGAWSRAEREIDKLENKMFERNHEYYVVKEKNNG